MRRHFLRLMMAGILMGATACTAEPAEPPTPEPAPVKEDDFPVRAKALTDSFMKTLKGELQKAMADGGPVNAIAVCSEAAPKVTAAAGGEGLTLRRVGVRVRNKKTNVPTDAERAILERLEKIPEFTGDVDGKRTYMRAIRMGSPVCSTCHGPRESLSADVAATLAERYPDDEAVGFAEGDLRGAFVVKEAL